MRPFLAPPAPRALTPGPPASFSVITATYQAAGTVAAAVESALAQTVAPYEVVVVDDGSTDDTMAALAPYRSRIVYVRQENRGTSAALNLAARTATGEFVAILDADDVYEPERIEALSELSAERPDLDVLMTDAYLESGGEVVGRFCDRTPFAVSRQTVEIFERCFVAWPAVRREALLAVGGFNEGLRVGHDWECWIRLLHAGATAGIVPEPLMRYRITPQSLTGDRVSDLRDRVTILELAAKLDLTPDERRELERFLVPRRRRALLAEAEQALRERRKDARRRALAVALAPSIGLRGRIRAVAAALAPGAAARRLDRRADLNGSSRIRRTVPPPS
jgi:hypothetical protein